MLDDIAWSIRKKVQLQHTKGIDFNVASIGTPLTHPGHGTLFHGLSYEQLDKVHCRLEQVRTELSQFWNCDRRGIVFGQNTTSAFETALTTLPLKEGDHIITTNQEYDSMPMALQAYIRRQPHNITLEMVETGPGLVERITRSIKPQTALIFASHITHLAERLPAEEIGKVAKERGIPYIVDAAQTAGHIPCDIPNLHADIVVSCGHKWLRTDTIAAFAYYAPHRPLPASRSTPFDTIESDRTQAYWFVDYDGWGNSDKILELGSNLQTFRSIGWDAIYNRIATLGAQAYGALEANPKVEVLHHTDGMVNFRMHGRDSKQVRAQLAAHNIFVTYKPTNHSLRIATSPYNTPSDIRQLDRTLRAL